MGEDAVTGRERRALRRDAALVDRLRGGDRAAFTAVVTDYSPVMRHVARGYVATAAAADDIVQEAWLVVIRSLDDFQGRSSLRTWIVGIVINLARRRGVQDARSVPWSAVDSDGTGTVDPARFQGPDDPSPGAWTTAGAPARWSPERRALDAEAGRLLVVALAKLPEAQRSVVTLRDVDGLTGEEVCAALGLTPGNQRILLHRGRARLRQELEDYYRGGGPDGH
jgi:RNA polymerase sigma-70 factor (ECF subfamily)